MKNERFVIKIGEYLDSIWTNKDSAEKSLIRRHFKKVYHDNREYFINLKSREMAIIKKETPKLNVVWSEE